MKQIEKHVDVRVANQADVPDLVRLNALFNEVTESPAQFTLRLDDPHRVEHPLVVEVDGMVVGFASLRLVHCLFAPETRAELTELFVEEQYRRYGIASRLVVFAERLAAENGAVEMFILTGRDNLPAQSLYRANGYREDELVLHKGL